MSDSKHRIKCITPDVGWYERSFPIPIIKYRVNDDVLLDSLISMMDETGDEMGFTTNLFCQMTEYKTQLNSKYKDIFEDMIGIVENILIENKLHLKVSDIWCAKYKSDDYAREHNHRPCRWSFCMNLNESEDFPPLEIQDGRKIYSERGNLLFFPGWVLHQVKPKKFSGSRYVCAGNTT